jgi:hypothetical protein
MDYELIIVVIVFLLLIYFSKSSKSGDECEQESQEAFVSINKDEKQAKPEKKCEGDSCKR